jgi:hypothetical protein
MPSAAACITNRVIFNTVTDCWAEAHHFALRDVTDGVGVWSGLLARALAVDGLSTHFKPSNATELSIEANRVELVQTFLDGVEPSRMNLMKPIEYLCEGQWWC